jgi:4-hydroxy-3-methylbut-2-enyl diphosphate reductase
VVAYEIRYHPIVVPCPWAGSLAELLEREGVPVVVGPVATVNRLAFRHGLARMAADGVTAVDMESFPLVEARDERPWAVVRVVVDTHDRPLLRPATVRSGIVARSRLRDLGPMLRTWASAPVTA